MAASKYGCGERPVPLPATGIHRSCSTCRFWLTDADRQMGACRMEHTWIGGRLFVRKRLAQEQGNCSLWEAS